MAKKGTYKRFNGSIWEDFHFSTSVDQVEGLEDFIKDTVDEPLPVIFGYSTTAIGTSAKVVSATGSSTPFTGYIKNQLYVIEFQVGNTAISPTININGFGSKTVRHLRTNGSTTTQPGTDILYSRTRFLVTFVYDGTYMIPIGVANRNAEVSLVGYSKKTSAQAITISDTILDALGKLEYKVDNVDGGGSLDEYGNYVYIPEGDSFKIDNLVNGDGIYYVKFLPSQEDFYLDIYNYNSYYAEIMLKKGAGAILVVQGGEAIMIISDKGGNSFFVRDNEYIGFPTGKGVSELEIYIGGFKI